MLEMNLTPLYRLQNGMNRIFEGFFEELPGVRPYGVGYPALNMWEDEENCYVEADLPGMKLDEIEVLVMGNELTIKGERLIEEQKEATLHRRERSHGQFTRTLTLPWDINAEKVEAKLHEGVLTIKLPKAESAKPRKVKLATA
jgi:HSP20 family protein